MVWTPAMVLRFAITGAKGLRKLFEILNRKGVTLSDAEVKEIVDAEREDRDKADREWKSAMDNELDRTGQA